MSLHSLSRLVFTYKSYDFAGFSYVFVPFSQNNCPSLTLNSVQFFLRNLVFTKQKLGFISTS